MPSEDGPGAPALVGSQPNARGQPQKQSTRDWMEEAKDGKAGNQYEKKRGLRDYQEMVGLSVDLTGLFGRRRALSYSVPPEERNLFDGRFEVHDKVVSYAPTSLLFGKFSLTNAHPVRRRAVWLMEWAWFDRGIIFAIVANSILQMVTLSRGGDPTTADVVLDKCFTAIFTIEAAIRIVSMGFLLGRNTYLKNPWNAMDFAVVVTALADIDLSIMRCFRLLRPLRTLNKFPGLRLIVSTILKSIPQLGDLVMLALFVFSVFGIIGMNLMADVSWSRCRTTPEPLPNGDWPTVGERFCGGGYDCTEEEELSAGQSVFCGSSLSLWREQRSQASLERVETELADSEEAHFGLTGFHHFGSAIFTIFQVATMEGWEELLYRYMDGFNGPFSIFFFSMCVLLGNLFVMNLIMAIFAMAPSPYAVCPVMDVCPGPGMYRWA